MTIRPAVLSCGALAVLLAAAGCSSGTGGRTSPAATSIASTRPAAVVQARVCNSSQLSVTVNQYAAGGFGILARNHGAYCRLVGAPDVQGYDEQGRRIAVAKQSAGVDDYSVGHAATAISWMTINVQHTSCKVEIASLAVRLPAESRPVTVHGQWWARPSARHPYGCGRGPSVSPERPYVVETTRWSAATPAVAKQ